MLLDQTILFNSWMWALHSISKECRHGQFYRTINFFSPVDSKNSWLHNAWCTWLSTASHTYHLLNDLLCLCGLCAIHKILHQFLTILTGGIVSLLHVFIRTCNSSAVECPHQSFPTLATWCLHSYARWPIFVSSTKCRQCHPQAISLRWHCRRVFHWSLTPYAFRRHFRQMWPIGLCHWYVCPSHGATRVSTQRSQHAPVVDN